VFKNQIVRSRAMTDVGLAMPRTMSKAKHLGG
jgi:hypothetical protein